MQYIISLAACPGPSHPDAESSGGRNSSPASPAGEARSPRRSPRRPPGEPVPFPFWSLSRCTLEAASALAVLPVGCVGFFFKATILRLFKGRFIQNLVKEHHWAKGRQSFPLWLVWSQLRQLSTGHSGSGPTVRVKGQAGGLLS